MKPNLKIVKVEIKELKATLQLGEVIVLQKRRMIGRCPVCEGEMIVTRLRCIHCETAIEGTFEINKFSRLSKEHLDFVEVFLRARGNIKEVERELGISYPTVRGRLESVLEALGYKPEPAAVEEINQGRQAKRKEILDALNRGELSSEEALKQLKNL